MNIVEYLKVMVETDASDLYLTVGSPPVYRIQGVMRPIGDHVFLDERTRSPFADFIIIG